jgi:hypothetical protein
VRPTLSSQIRPRCLFSAVRPIRFHSCVRCDSVPSDAVLFFFGASVACSLLSAFVIFDRQHAVPPSALCLSSNRQVKQLLSLRFRSAAALRASFSLCGLSAECRSCPAASNLLVRDLFLPNLETSLSSNRKQLLACPFKFQI